ncbi:MAG: hypothetical protein QMD23_06680, partial [Candidatus Bathyarchaeia archaeon]|nr:hypothetical protein [Candidatus Bathyarchaeia archaeon]
SKAKMSRTALNAILNEMQVWLNEIEREQLYNELLAYFGLIGATNECEALENAWKDPYNKREIEEFIKAWLKRKQRKKEEAITGVV